MEILAAFIVGVLFSTIIGIAVYYATKTDELVEDFQTIKNLINCSSVIKKYTPKKKPKLDDFIGSKYRFDDMIVTIDSYYDKLLFCSVGPLVEDQRKVHIDQFLKMLRDGELKELTEDEYLLLNIK
tara:strand:- start:758 stop:1135 length:378 start_codon:yes stop_codon:yes gene_type:complete